MSYRADYEFEQSEYVSGMIAYGDDVAILSTIKSNDVNNATVFCGEFKVINTRPPVTISSLSPSSVPTGSATFTLTVNGTDFVSGAVIVFDGTELTTQFTSDTQLSATVPAALLVSSRPVKVLVKNTDGGLSNAENFVIVRH